jgi:5'-nucleotidase
LALLGLIQDPIDIVVSGINPLANVGHDVTYSGTVTAAMEAAIFGLPGIATSIDSDREHGVDIAFDSAAEITSNLVHRFTDQHLPSGVFLNINIPNKLRAAINGARITRQGTRIYRDELVEREDPRGRKYFWIGGDAPTGVPEPGTDIGALSEGFVSITPLGLDLTAKDMVQNLETWNLQI